MAKNLIVSVESRKGGVGKTTTALALAKIFLKKGYEVLLLDLDLTGTNIINAANPLFWENNVINILKGKDSNNLDLIDLFSKEFIAGLPPQFYYKDVKDNKKNNQSGIMLDPSCINIIGSEMFDTKMPINELFDELHGIWFVEFLQYIQMQYIDKSLNNNTVLILDNSPGYVGFVSKIHDWLTDLGPGIGKFLIVSSLEKPDIIACLKHIDDIYKKGKDKQTAITSYNNNSEINDDSFDLSFYLKLTEDPSILENYKIINEPNYVYQYDTFIALLINKVKDDIYTNKIKYDYGVICNMPEMKGNKYINERGNASIETYFQSKMIPYDKYLEYQFVIDLIPSGLIPPANRRGVSNIRKDILRIIKIQEDIFYKSPNDIDAKIDLTVLSVFQSRYNNIIRRMKNNSLNLLVDLLDDRWTPLGIVGNLSPLFYEFRKSNINMHDTSDISNEDIEPNTRQYNNIKDMVESVYIELIDYARDDRVLLAQLYYSCTTIIYFMLGNNLIDNIQLLRHFVVPLVKYQLKEWKKDVFNITLQEHLIAQKESDAFEKYYNTAENIKISNEYDVNNINELYQLMSVAQARIIDLNKDYMFLLKVIAGMLERVNDSKIFLPYLREIMEEVVINKSKSHEEAEKEIQEALNSRKYLDNLTNIIERQIIPWGKI